MPNSEAVRQEIERAVLSAIVDSASRGLDQLDEEVGVQGRAWALRKLGEGNVSEYEEPGFVEMDLLELEMETLARALGEHRMKIRAEGRAAEQGGFEEEGYALYYLVDQTNVLLRRIRNVKGTGEPLRLSQVDVTNAMAALHAYEPGIKARKQALRSLNERMSARSNLIMDIRHGTAELSNAIDSMIPQFAAAGDFDGSKDVKSPDELSRRF